MSASNVCFKTTPVVKHPSFIQVTKDGNVLGEVDATFDFSNLPGEYHILALKLLSGHRIVIQSDSHVEISEPEQKAWWKFWD
jgi:hypothetical protein